MITTRADLDALADTQQHADFLAMLAGSIYRLPTTMRPKAGSPARILASLSNLDFHARISRM